MNVPIPPDAHEELKRLGTDDESPALVWRRARTDTAFRRQMLPHADRDDDNFRIVVPVSGGLDSATCYQMAVVAGLPVEPVTVTTGVPYAVHDAAAAHDLTSGHLHTIAADGGWHTIGDFHVGRNSVIVWRLLEWGTANGWWGEVWLGNVGGNYLETPIVGGDKSYRWAATMQHLATTSGHDFRLTSPLGGLSKADLVTWWHARGLCETALSTRSCFADTPHQCGRCWACLHRYVAFAARGHREAVLATYPDGVDFAAAAEEFWERVGWEVVTTAPERMREVYAVLDDLGLRQR